MKKLLFVIFLLTVSNGFSQEIRINAVDQLRLKSISATGVGSSVGFQYDPFPVIYGTNIAAGVFKALYSHEDVRLSTFGAMKSNQIFPASTLSFVGTTFFPFRQSAFETVNVNRLAPLNGNLFQFDVENVHLKKLYPFDYFSSIGEQYLPWKNGWFANLDADTLEVRSITQNGAPLELDVDLTTIESDSIKVDTLEVVMFIDASAAYADLDSIRTRVIDIGTGTVKISDTSIIGDSLYVDAIVHTSESADIDLNNAIIDNLTLNSSLSTTSVSTTSLTVNGENQDDFFADVTAGGQVTNAGIADDAITNAKLADDAVTGDKIQALTIEQNDLTLTAQNWVVFNAGSGGSITNHPDDVTLTNTDGDTLALKVGDSVNGVQYEHFSDALKDSVFFSGQGPVLYNIEFYGAHPDSGADWNSDVIKAVCAKLRAQNYGGFFVPRKYEIADRVVIDWDGAAVIGFNPYTSGFMRADSFNGNWQYDGGPSYNVGAQIVVWGVNGFRMENFSMDSQFRVTGAETGNMNPLVFQYCEDAQYINNRVVNISGHTYGNWWQHCRNVVIRDSYYSGDFDNASGNGTPDAQELLEIVVGENFKIENCTFKNSAGQGVYVYNAPFDGSVANLTDVNGVRQIEIRSCTFDSLRYGVRFIQGSGADNYLFRNIKVENNDFQHCSEFGAKFETTLAHESTAFEHLRDLHVTKNTFDQNDVSLSFYIVDSAFVKQNTIKGDSLNAGSSASSPLEVSYLCDFFVIENNEIIESPFAGLSFSDNTSRIFVKGNTIYKPAYSGMYLQGTGKKVVLNNLIIEPNQNDNVTASTGSGIYAQGLDRTTILNNLVEVDASDVKALYRLYVFSESGTNLFAPNYSNESSLADSIP